MFQLQFYATTAFETSPFVHYGQGLLNSVRQNIEEFISNNRTHIEKYPVFLTLFRVELFISNVTGGKPSCYVVAGCQNLDLKIGHSVWAVYMCLPQELSEVKTELDSLCLPRANAVGNVLHLTQSYLNWCKHNNMPLPTGKIGSRLNVIREYSQEVDVQADNGGTYLLPWICISPDDLLQPIKSFVASNQLYNLGIEAHQRTNYKEAITYYTKAISLHKNHQEAYSRRGDAKDEIGDYDGALADYNTALELASKDFFTLHNRAWLKLKRLGKVNQALIDVEAALAINPDYEMAYVLRAECMIAQSKFKAALKDVEKALKLEPNLHSAIQIRTQLYSSGFLT